MIRSSDDGSRQSKRQRVAKMPAAVNSEILDRLPPSDVDAERRVIGGVLLDERRFDDVAGVVDAGDFYGDATRRVWERIFAMHDRRQPIDAALVVADLESAGVMGKADAVAFLGECLKLTPVAENVGYYAKRVHDLGTKRAVIHASLDALQSAWNPTSEADAVLDQAEAAFAQVRMGGAAATETTSMESATLSALARIDAIVRRKESGGVPIGLRHFDDDIGGLFPGELCILAARPSIGKTALAMQAAKHAAERRGRVLFVSLEMKAEDLALRELAVKSGVPFGKIRAGKIGDADLRALSDAGNDVGQSSIVLMDRSGVRVSEVRRVARRLAKDDLVLIVVDYLQLIQPVDRSVQRHEQVGRMSADLKQLAMELRIPVLCLAQLNRQAEQSERPALWHLRESGDVEANADQVLLLHRQKEESAGVLILAKNRNGIIGDFPVEWHGASMRYSAVVDQEACPPAGAWSEFTGYQ